MPEETPKKTYLGKPQLIVKRVGKIVQFTCPDKTQFYVLLSYLKGLCYGRGHNYIYANEFFPFKTVKSLKEVNKKA